MRKIDEPVPYRLAEAGEALLRELDAIVDATSFARPQGTPAIDGPIAPDGSKIDPLAVCGALSVDPERRCSRRPGHSGAHRMDRAFGSRSREALGRITGCDSTMQRVTDKGMPKREVNAAAVTTDRTAKTEPPEDPHTIPSCQKCRQLLLELDVAVRDFATLAKPLVTQLSTISHNQVKAFEERLKPISDRVRTARRTYEKHRARCEASK
jgi:hypothetical protein